MIFLLSFYLIYMYEKWVKKKKYPILLIHNLINHFSDEIACFHLNYRLMFRVLKKLNPIKFLSCI